MWIIYALADDDGVIFYVGATNNLKRRKAGGCSGAKQGDRDMTKHEQRLAVSREAMTWLRTPYVSEGRIKGACADCTFFAKMYEDLGILPHVDIPHYSPQAHLNREMMVYLELVQDHTREVDEPDVGDIVLYKIGRGWSHGGVIVEPGWPHIVHADLAAGAVVMARGDQAALASAPRRYFSPWPIRG